jgi:hypothetical protein
VRTAVAGHGAGDRCGGRPRQAGDPPGHGLPDQLRLSLDRRRPRLARPSPETESKHHVLSCLLGPAPPPPPGGDGDEPSGYSDLLLLTSPPGNLARVKAMLPVMVLACPIREVLRAPSRPQLPGQEPKII